MKFKINRAIFGGFSLVIVLMVLWFGFFSWTSEDELKEISNDLAGLIEEGQRVRKLQIDLTWLNNSHTQLFENPTSENLRIFIDNIQLMANNLEEIQKSAPAQIAQLISGNIENLFTNLGELKTHTEKEYNTETKAGGGESVKSFVEQVNLIGRVTLELLTIQSIITQKELINEVNVIPEIMSKNYRLVFIVFAGVILISILLAFFIAHKIKNKITGISEDLHKASKDILETANKEEETFLEQSASIDKTATTISELSRTAGEMANDAHNVSEQMANTAERMTDMQQKAQQIDKISSTIEEITTQINILSLNAAIEAARAGEQGKGFSAVASEIRKLAENTRGFTDNIGMLIHDIQNSVREMAEFSDQAVVLVKNISKSVVDQNLATEEIDKSVSVINVNMKKTADNIRATVESSERLHQLSEQMKEMS